eukprot:g3282.t1
MPSKAVAAVLCTCPSLWQALHLVCELVDRENFSNSWRILKTLKEGNAFGAIDINTPRSSDGWTPLCIACADACLPLAFKLLELNADPNVITRSNDTPLSLAKRGQPEDNEEQREARGIISNMLRSYGAQDSWLKTKQAQVQDSLQSLVLGDTLASAHPLHQSDVLDMGQVRIRLAKVSPLIGADDETALAMFVGGVDHSVPNVVRRPLLIPPA